MSIIIRLATKADRKAMMEMLQETNINQDGVGKESNYFIIAESVSEKEKKLVAIAGIEKRGEYGILRSFVLEANMWKGLDGVTFLENVMKLTSRLQLKELYLLTLPGTQNLLEDLHFKVVELHQVPRIIKESDHFIKSHKESVVIMKNY